MTIYNIMSCEGFEEFGQGIFGGKCNITWTADLLILACVFFLCLILRKQCQDGVLAGINYNHLLALILGCGLSLVGTIFFGYPWVAIVGGLVGIGLGGFGIGYFFNTADSGGSDGGSDEIQ